MALEDEFIHVGARADAGAQKERPEGEFYDRWQTTGSAKHSFPPFNGAHALRQIYPNHSLVMTQDFRVNILGFPQVFATPLEKDPLLTQLVFISLSRRDSPIPGAVIDQMVYGGFKVKWREYELLLYVVQYPTPRGNVITQQYLLHNGPDDPARDLVLAATIFAEELHDEIWVYNQGFWFKDHAMWTQIQKADWKDVIMKDAFKKALRKDVEGFFASEKIYKELAIPWKRGLIMYGPPGNGKTISLKAIMKTCSEQGYAPLYVQSFQSRKGEEASMAEVFEKARQVAPCVIIPEDLDSLINDKNRSFFLNQLDGLEGNNGLLIIGTTNHFERLDPGLSTRPSRFDRKYKFDDPDRDERALYARYWQKKLASNKQIEFPDSLVDEVADLTDKFSFAYLKEAFVSTLVTLAGIEGDDKPSFEKLLKEEIQTLRSQLDKQVLSSPFSSADPVLASSTPSGTAQHPELPAQREYAPNVDPYYSRAGVQCALDRIYTIARPTYSHGNTPHNGRGRYQG
ncbi:hypothetical protein M422DRAFT_26292 [Sphaerobolus stellatus SS14]|nr:hypothetical protein M422DRAFT_26292 [Sphaerobolus stellatus SS14]